MQDEKKLLLSCKEIRALLGLSMTAWYKLLRAGWFRPVPQFKNFKKYPRSQVDKFVNQPLPENWKA